MKRPRSKCIDGGVYYYCKYAKADNCSKSSYPCVPSITFPAERNAFWARALRAFFLRHPRKHPFSIFSVFSSHLSFLDPLCLISSEFCGCCWSAWPLPLPQLPDASARERHSLNNSRHTQALFGQIFKLHANNFKLHQPLPPRA